MKLPSFCRRNRRPAAFTLVEVILTLGVVAFAVIPMVGMLPLGLQHARKAMDITVVSQIGQRLLMEAQESNFETLEQLVNSEGAASLSFDDQGNRVATGNTAVYEASYTLHRPDAGNSAAGLLSSRLQVASSKFRIVEIEVLNRSSERDEHNPMIFTALVSGEAR